MRKTLMLLILAVFAQTAFAQSFVQEKSFSKITRRTGGTQYVINVKKATQQIVLTLEAELKNPNLSSHKIQLHSVKYITASGGEVIVQSNSFLTNTNAKLSLSLNSSENISRIVITAESWRSYHGMYVSIEGQVAVIDNSAQIEADRRAEEARRLAEVEAQIRADQAAARVAEEAVRRQAEEQARRDAEEAQRQAEINAEVDRREQARCASELNFASRSADNCVQFDLQEALGQYSDLEHRVQRGQRRLERKQEPLNTCRKEQTAKVEKIDRVKSRYEALSNRFSTANRDMKNLKAKTVEATGSKFKCVMSRVGKKRRGTYQGVGSTKAQALMEALKTCPRVGDNGCGKHNTFRADINCVKIQ